MSAELRPGAAKGGGRATGAQDDALSEFLRDNTQYATREEFWQAVQQSIKDRLGLERYSIWFRQTELMGGDSKRLVQGSYPNFDWRR